MEIAIISGKGGTGKSCIAAAFAGFPDKSVLADCDVDASNQYLLFQPVDQEVNCFTGASKARIKEGLCINCRLCVSFCNFGAISFRQGEIKISEIDCDGCGLCARICPEHAIWIEESSNSSLHSGSFRYGRMVYGKLAAGEENSGKLVNLVRQKARQQAAACNIDFIIIDGPPGIGCPVISAVSGADTAVVVTEPSLSGLNDLQRVVEVVAGFDIPIHVVVNKYDLNENITRKIIDFCSIRGLNFTGKIPFDISMVKSVVNCQTITEYAPASQLSICLEGIWANIRSKVFS